MASTFFCGINQIQALKWVVSGLPPGPGDDYQFYIQDVPNQNSWDYGSVFAICPIYGCTDSNALNYDSLATLDDGTCYYCIYGCTDQIR